MDPSSPERGHAAVVDEWLARSLDHGSTIEIVRLFHAGFEALWNRAVTALGSITLRAIVERVLHHAIERYAFLSVIDPRRSGDPRVREHLYEHLATVPRALLIEGLRFGMIELLEVIGTLTAELLARELHGALDTATATSRGSNPSIESPAFTATPKVSS